MENRDLLYLCLGFSGTALVVALYIILTNLFKKYVVVFKVMTRAQKKDDKKWQDYNKIVMRDEIQREAREEIGLLKSENTKLNKEIERTRKELTAKAQIILDLRAEKEEMEKRPHVTLRKEKYRDPDGHEAKVRKFHDSYLKTKSVAKSAVIADLDNSLCHRLVNLYDINGKLSRYEKVFNLPLMREKLDTLLAESYTLSESIDQIVDLVNLNKRRTYIAYYSAMIALFRVKYWSMPKTAQLTPPKK